MESIDSSAFATVTKLKKNSSLNFHQEISKLNIIPQNSDNSTNSNNNNYNISPIYSLNLDVSNAFKTLPYTKINRQPLNSSIINFPEEEKESSTIDNQNNSSIGNIYQIPPSNYSFQNSLWKKNQMEVKPFENKNHITPLNLNNNQKPSLSYNNNFISEQEVQNNMLLIQNSASIEVPPFQLTQNNTISSFATVNKLPSSTYSIKPKIINQNVVLVDQNSTQKIVKQIPYSDSLQYSEENPGEMMLDNNLFSFF